MLFAVNGLAGADTVSVVGVGVATKGLELTTLLPGQGMAQIGSGIILSVIPVYLLSGEKSISRKTAAPVGAADH